MEKINIRFADMGGVLTSFVSRLLVENGAVRIYPSGNGDIEILKLCDVVLDCGNLDYDKLCSYRKDIILVSITGFGLTGPKKDWKADSFIAAAAGGSMHMCGKEDGPPLAPAGDQAEKIAGLYALNGIMLTLLERRRTGTGKHLDISLQEAVAGSLDIVLVRNFYYHENPHRTGSVSWIKQNFIVPCSNGHIMVHIRPSEWRTVVDWMDGDGMACDLTETKWEDRDYRNAHFDHIIEVISQWSSLYTKEELFETAQLMRMGWAYVRTAEVSRT